MYVSYIHCHVPKTNSFHHKEKGPSYGTVIHVYGDDDDDDDSNMSRFQTNHQQAIQNTRIIPLKVLEKSVERLPLVEHQIIHRESSHHLLQSQTEAHQ